jgi:hypothetical protein
MQRENTEIKQVAVGLACDGLHAGPDEVLEILLIFAKYDRSDRG